MALDISKYPLALQLLMQTDGTVTELIKLLAQEEIQVKKLSEVISKEHNVLNRHIFLQGVSTKKNWLYAESKIFLDNLTNEFVSDLLEKSIPIGSLWAKYQIETYKELVNQHVFTLDYSIGKDFEKGCELLVRTYHVINNKKVIMEITEKFPIKIYKDLL